MGSPLASGDRAALADQIAEFAETARRRGYVLKEDGGRVKLDPIALSAEDAAWIRELALREDVGSTLEVGLGLGMGSLVLAEAVLRGSSDAPAHVTLDPFATTRLEGAGLRTLRDSGAERVVEFVPAPSLAVLPRLVLEGRSFDLAFIDGDHHFDGAFIDLFYCARVVRPGGVVVVDDMWQPSVRTAVAFYVENRGWEIMGDASPAAFRWVRSRRPWRRRPVPVNHVAALRMPENPGAHYRPDLVPFW